MDGSAEGPVCSGQRGHQPQKRPFQDLTAVRGRENAGCGPLAEEGDEGPISRTFPEDREVKIERLGQIYRLGLVTLFGPGGRTFSFFFPTFGGAVEGPHCDGM